MNEQKQNSKSLEEMINLISNEEKLCELLRVNDIADIETVNSIRHYEMDGNRRGMIVDAKLKSAVKSSKIMIDLKQGEPIINQVYDSLYGIGKDCQKRIILYTEIHNDYDTDVPAADSFVITSLICELQRYPLGLRYYRFKEDPVEFDDSFYFIYGKPDESLPVSNIPNQEQFMVRTFWKVYFESFNNFYEQHIAFKDAFNRVVSDTKALAYIIFINCSFFGEIRLFWDSDGIRYEVVQFDDDDDYLKTVLEYEMPELQKQYGPDAVKFENVVGIFPRLHIKYSEKPFDWLYTASPHQTTEFAKKMYDDAWGLRWRIEERVDGIMERKSA